ncbi:MAG TPA: hypothetical protein VGB37_03725 [Candidatus Lokiarchaeia archaeon]
MILQLTLIRIIQVYVAQGFVFAFFLAIALKILVNNRKRIMLIFSGFYLSVAIGIFFNFIYAPLTNPNLVKTLNFLTNFFITYGTIFLMVFCLIFFKGESNVSSVKQYVIFLVYGILLLCSIFIPNGVEISQSTGWSPHWNLLFFIYIAMVMTVMACVPTLIFSFKISKKFEDEFLKKKWKFFIIGIIELYIFLYGTYLSNMLNIQAIRTVWAIISLILTLSGAYFVYYGVAKKFKK